ncbi:MAG: GAF domain-containing sensor histidine kinase [Chloroflexi bacterium]|nr:GAF domain-containing sensor histidine kinase [Chloroflexota bacterium]NOG74941.1 GAF domain-containing sensor histidine kinase [Chloroflexota bacterium]
MFAVYFLYGLAFFSLGIVIWAEKRRASDLPLAHQLPWLAAFAFLHSLVEWLGMFALLPHTPSNLAALEIAHAILLPLSCLFLVRFGIGLIEEAGPLPNWMTFAPVVLIVPLGLLIAFGLVFMLTSPLSPGLAETWARYLLYFPGNLLAGIGLIRQSHRLKLSYPIQASRFLKLVSAAFFVNAIAAGLIVPPGTGGLPALLNEERLLALTGLPVQIWRAALALAIALLFVGALRIFEFERNRKLSELEEQKQEVQRAAISAKAQALQVSEAWTEALVDISRRIANLEDVDSILQTIAQSARRLLHADIAALALWDESETGLEIRCAAFPDEVTFQDASRIETHILISAARKTEPTLFPQNFASSPDPWTCPALGREVHAAAMAPLRLDTQPIGIFWVGREAYSAFSTDDLIRLERLAAQAVIALEHALMTSRLQSLAMMEERGRIAREMHDGLAQVLGYVGIELQTIEALTRLGEREAVLRELRQAHHNIQIAQADVRENILSLRTTLSNEKGLIPALQEYVEEFGVQTGIQTQFLYELPNDPALSPLAETQLIRIIQEALANVRKHARAEHAQVRLTRRNGSLRALVTDDGVGFEYADKRGHYGLLTMRERAEAAGGGLIVASQPGRGTQVETWMPVLK